MTLTAFDLAQRFVGVKETPGAVSTPLILAMLRLDEAWPTDDAVPWCSAFVNFVAWLLRLPRSKSLRARSWLEIGRPIGLQDATAAFDVVVLSRGIGNGHVGFFASLDAANSAVLILGGNQHNAVTVAPFPSAHILGVRRLHE